MFYQLHDKDQTPNEGISFIFLAYPSLSAAHLSHISCLSFFYGTHTFSLKIIERMEKNIDVSFPIPLPFPNFFLYICSHLYVRTQVVFLKKHKWDTCYLLLNHILLLAVP